MPSPPVLTEEELETLFAAYDTFIPSISASELLQKAPNAAYADEKSLKEFAEEAPSQLANVRRIVTELIPKYQPPNKIADLKMALNLLRWVSMLPLSYRICTDDQ